MMTIQKLSEISGMKVDAVKKRLFETPGVRIDIPDGTRMRFDISRYKLDSREKRMIVLLDATNRFRYVDADMLKLDESSFQTMLKELEEVGLLQRNNSGNAFGANAYDTTICYEEYKNKKMRERIQFITNTISSGAGHFAGAFANEIAK